MKKEQLNCQNINLKNKGNSSEFEGIEFNKLKLHYAKINQVSDIPFYEFDDFELMMDFLDDKFSIIKNKKEEIVYLISYKNEIFVTESINYIMDFLETLNIGSYDWHGDDEYNIFIQEYPSFEEAYIVALSIKETSKLCYSSETKKSQYWNQTNKSI